MTSWLTRLFRRIFGGNAKSVEPDSITEALAVIAEEPKPMPPKTEPPPADPHAAFFREYERLFGKLTASQRSGLAVLLEKLSADPNMEDLRYRAYALATVKHECADTWLPIEEYGRGKNRPYGKPDPITKETYYGRGFVQLTWKENYRKLGELIGEDLVREPWRALEQNTAYRILSLGMVGGLFTNNALSAFINDTGCDYLGARRIVNAMDKAELIAGYAVRLEACLRAT